MKRKLLTLLTVMSCLCGAALVWSYYDGPTRDARPIETVDASPGRIFAYQLTLPGEMNAVALEIRRVSSPNDAKYTVGSVDGNLYVSRDEAELTISTGMIATSKVRETIFVSTCVLELDKFLTDSTSHSTWAVAGRIKIPGVSTDTTPKANFCRGGQLSTGWERYPDWRDREMCVGRFRSHDENRIYDYYCVVVASNSEMR